MNLHYFNFVVTGNSQSGNGTSWNACVSATHNLAIIVGVSSSININGITDHQEFNIPLAIVYHDSNIAIKVPSNTSIGTKVPVKVIVTNNGNGNSINSVVKVKSPKGFELNVASLPSNAKYDSKSHSII